MRKYILTAAMLALISAPAVAQDDIFMSKLLMLNQTQITRNPDMKTDDEIFQLKVLDSNRQLVGKIEDIKIDESGEVAKLVSEINKVGRRDNVVEHNAAEIQFHRGVNAFQVPLAYSAPEEVSPESLAAIAPAAGDSKIYSLKEMVGAEVLSNEGRYLGKVKHVMFDENAHDIRALVLEDVPGARRYTDIAIPFDSREIGMTTAFGDFQFRLAQDAAVTLTDFAKDHR